MARPPNCWALADRRVACQIGTESRVQNIETVEGEIIMAKQLNPGDQFPNYKVQLTDGRTLNIPQDLRGEYAVIIFYRGIW